MDGTGRSQRSEGLALIREQQALRRSAGPSHARSGWLRGRGGSAADPETKSVPVVILTSKSMTQQDKERLQGRITYVARKTEFNLSASRTPPLGEHQPPAPASESG